MISWAKEERHFGDVLDLLEVRAHIMDVLCFSDLDMSPGRAA